MRARSMLGRVSTPALLVAVLTTGGLARALTDPVAAPAVVADTPALDAAPQGADLTGAATGSGAAVVPLDAEPVYAVFETTVGPIAVELLPHVAPRHVAQLRRLIGLGVYDGVPIYRIQRGFVAQLGDARYRPAPLAPHQLKAIEKIPAELTAFEHERGVLSMARSEALDSAETSFSFLLGRAPHLDGRYTIFGRTLGSEATLRAIEEAAGPDPVSPLRLISIHRAALVDGATARERAAQGAAEIAANASDMVAMPRGTLIGLTGVVATLALATATAAFRSGGRGLISLALVTFLCAFFVVFTLLSQNLEMLGALRSWVSTLLFAVAILSFKLMGRYDSPGRSPAATPATGGDLLTRFTRKSATSPNMHKR